MQTLSSTELPNMVSKTRSRTDSSAFFIPLTDEQEKEITDKGITLEQHFSIDVTAKDGSKLRVFRKRNDIDLIELDSGRLAEKKGEAVVEKRYSEEQFSCQWAIAYRQAS